MQQRSKILLNEPKDKYDYSVIYVAFNSETIFEVYIISHSVFLTCIWEFILGKNHTNAMDTTMLFEEYSSYRAF